MCEEMQLDPRNLNAYLFAVFCGKKIHRKKLLYFTLINFSYLILHMSELLNYSNKIKVSKHRYCTKAHCVVLICFGFFIEARYNFCYEIKGKKRRIFT